MYSNAADGVYVDGWGNTVSGKHDAVIGNDKCARAHPRAPARPAPRLPFFLALRPTL